MSTITPMFIPEANPEQQRVEKAVQNGEYLDATAEILRKHGGLWFNDESFVVTRRRA
jgi:hypothetical protein